MRFGNYPSYHICKTLGLIPKSCFSLLWDQSQLQPVHDIGTDPKTLFFITLGSIPTMDCTWHWDWSQSPIFWPLGLIPMWHLDSAISHDLVIRRLLQNNQLTELMPKLWAYFFGCRAQALGLILRIQSLSSMLNFWGSELKLWHNVLTTSMLCYF